ncbi:MAG: DNA mismatch repair endonuclease MutL, partial [Clostridia bacterium]|nr:DNA mismatch repair endonuclease MutL [Clostridia bacterium]
MGKIQVLEKSVSNKIAAGEVVERPASVVKELLENALDAGATHVTVEIKNGGITYIRVTDNGSGMSREDVPVALLRHATSKIHNEKDLEGIVTLGFRGEALSSIAAVSKLEIYTRVAEEETGTHLVCEDGEIVECAEAGCPLGTTVLVRDLFMNTPARMKFLKKNYTEAGYVADIVNRLALAKSEVSFRLISDGKELLFTAGDSDLLNSIFAVYGKDLKNTMRPALFSDTGISVTGYCATGQGARPNRSMQNFFVNGRYIKSPLLTRAVEEAYKTELMGGKFPACVLLITLPPTLVDINVHPTKLEA